jgi:hypothetical protein
MAERVDAGILLSIAGTGLEPHYGTAVAGKKLGFGPPYGPWDETKRHIRA